MLRQKKILLFRRFLKQVLKSIGLQEVVQKAKYHCRGISHSYYKDFQELYRKIDMMPKTENRPVLILTGTLIRQQKISLVPFFEQIQQSIPDVRIIFLDETDIEPTSIGISCSFERLIVPCCIAGGRYDRQFKTDPRDEDNALIEQFPDIVDVAMNVSKRQNDMCNSYAISVTCAYVRMYQKLIDRLSPKAFIVWCKFSGFHQICQSVCKANDVKTLYMEFGSLPGTFALEDRGQMGESRWAVQWQEKLALPVTDEALEKAQTVWDFLYQSGLNRIEQDKTDMLDDYFGTLDPNRPFIVFAGQCDYDSGIFPYSHTSSVEHSPLFESSLEAAIFLWIICRKAGWQFVYKPHPFYKNDHYFFHGLPVITRCNFNKLLDRADCVVTILSQSNYMAALRKRPCVTLGYNQMRGKGYCYEAYTLEEIQPTIEKALQEGISDSMKTAFQRHIAQMLTYYLFDDLHDHELHFGQPPEAAAAYIQDTVL